MKALRKLQHFKIYPAEELSNVLNILSIMCLSTHIFEEFTEFSVDNRTLNKLQKRCHCTIFKRN